jgi:hypothetical protein
MTPKLSRPIIAGVSNYECKTGKAGKFWELKGNSCFGAGTLNNGKS